ncbi:MAG: hypothetical protein R2762_26400 [Bryobacteraceae bacterium]
MKQLVTFAACAALTAGIAAADSHAFRGIIGDAANIEKDAQAISYALKPKMFDSAKIRADVEQLGVHIATLRKDVETLDGNLASLSAQQQTDWELVKTKVQLLTIFYDRKNDLMNGDLMKNRSLIRANADGIAKRARMLQQTASRLDR